MEQRLFVLGSVWLLAISALASSPAAEAGTAIGSWCTFLLKSRWASRPIQFVQVVADGPMYTFVPDNQSV